MKKWILSLVLVFLVAGCNEGMTAKLNELTTASRTLIEQVEGYQVASTGIVSALESAGLVDAEMVAKLDHFNAEIDKVQPQVAGIADAIDKADTSGDDIAAILAALQAGNTASAPVNPYAGPIGGVLAIIGIIYGALKNKEATKADKRTDRANIYANDAADAERNAQQELQEAEADLRAAQAKYEAHKQGLEKTMINATPDMKELVYTNIGDARVRLNVT